MVKEATLGRRLRIVDAGALRPTDSFYPAGQANADHTHADTSLVFGLAGVLTQRHGAVSGDLRPGRWLVLPHGVEHSDRVGPAGCGCLFLTLRAPDALELSPPGSALGTPAFLDDARASGIGLRLQRELWLDDRFQLLALEGLALELIAEIGRIRAPDAPPRARRLARVREFSRVFGSTIAAYARGLRVQWAAREIAGSDRPIAAIAFEAGFVDQSHLTRVFRRTFGVTPGRYRAEHGVRRGIRTADLPPAS